MPGYDYIESGSGMTYIGEIKGVDLDLAKYDIDIVEQDGKVYLPFCTFNDIFLVAGPVMRYRNEKLTLAIAMNVMGSKGVFDDTRSKAFAEFSYDSLCFAIDNFCGRPSNAVLTNSIADAGLDNALDSYNTVTPRIKELLLSENTEEYCVGLALLQYYLDDGGHTMLLYSLDDRLSYYGIRSLDDAAEKAFGSERSSDVEEMLSDYEEKNKIEAMSGSITTEKSAAYSNFELIRQWQGVSLYRSGDTYFCNIDGFDQSIIAPFKESMDYAQENGAKNFIVDVTTNGGGDDLVAVYLISLMCDTYSFGEKDVTSGNKVRFTARIDKNLDGKFDEEDDKLKYDFRCAVIAGAGSYSCANIFPCMAQDHGICLIGEQTAGGSCAVIPRLYANGTGYNASGYMMYLREDDKDADAGASPDVPMPGYEMNYNGFFDVNAINKGIAEFYGDPIPQTTGVYGDVDGDGKVSAKDSLLIQRYVIKLVQLGDVQQKAADVNGDGKITAKDALEIQRYSIGHRILYNKRGMTLLLISLFMRQEL